MPIGLRPSLSRCALLVLAFVLAPRLSAGGDADGWRQKIGVADPDDAFRAIEQAGAQKAVEAAIPLLETAVATRYPFVAVACGEALATLGAWPTGEAQASNQVRKWIDREMKSKEIVQLRNLARVLGAWGHPLVDEPLSQLASGRRSPEVQVEGLFMAGYLKPRKEAPFADTHKSVERALDSRSADVRAAACSVAARWKAKEFRDALVSIARTDQDPFPGLYAVWALSLMGETVPVSAFTHVLENNPKRTTRQACLKGITELTAPGEVLELVTLSRNSKKDYRDAAVLAIARLAWRGAFKTKSVEGPAKTVIPDEVIDRLIQIVGEDSEWEVRDAARQALLRIGDAAKEKVTAAMPAFLEFSDDDVRETAAELCGLFQVQGAFRSLYKTATLDKSATARMFAARALEGSDAKQAVSELAKQAQSNRKGGPTELNAIRALGYVRTTGSYDALVGMLNGGFSEPMLREVEYALERLTGHRFGRKPDRWKAWFGKESKPFQLRVRHFDRVANRREAVAKGLYGITPDTEKMVENGLRWLELQQHPGGTWDGNEKGFGGVVNCLPAYTGLSLLALLGAGYNERTGKYHETIRRASEFLAATQFYDGGFPVVAGGDDSWIFAYLIAMGVWAVNETYALSGDDAYRAPAQWGIDYLVRVQTPGGGWRYGPRYVQSDTSCTSWTLMAIKSGDLSGLEVAQKSYDGIDSWLERCSYDMTGEEEVPEDLSTDYDHEVGSRRYFKAFTGYFELGGSEKSSLQQTSMTAVGMICRFFMGWKRSHPYMIGCANYLMDFLPQWMKGLEKGQAIAWYHYYWYYGTISMHQMGGRFWRAWNAKAQALYRQNQRTSPADLIGSWDPDTAVLNGGRLFSTPMSVLSLETYYRFSPLLSGDVEAAAPAGAGDKPPGDGKPPEKKGP